MKLITKPTLYLVGRQSVDEEELSRFLADHDVAIWQTDTEVAGEKLVEVAGRACFMSYARPRPGGNKAYIDHIMEVGHFSVTEHAVWNVLATGVSRSLSHELVRHRHISPSQLSQRYVDESVAEYVVPPDLQEEVALARCWQEMERSGVVGSSRIPVVNDIVREQMGRDWVEGDYEKMKVGCLWLQTIWDAHDSYKELADYLANKARKERPDLPPTDARKFARQAARSVLPNATETKLFLTMNARAARHFITLRASRHADPEIRVLAHALWQILVAESPALFGDFCAEVLPDGTVELTTPHSKA